MCKRQTTVELHLYEFILFSALTFQIFFLFFYFFDVQMIDVFRLNCLYIQHLKYILFCCTLVSKCIQVAFTKT